MAISLESIYKTKYKAHSLDCYRACFLSSFMTVKT